MPSQRRAPCAHLLPFTLLTLITLIALLSLLTHSSAAHSLFGPVFSPDSLMGGGARSRDAPPNTPDGFSDQSAYVHLSRSGALIAAADFNQDRLVDLLFLDSQDLRRLSVAFWHHDRFAFEHRGDGIVLDRLPSDHPATALRNIRGAHVADFNDDGTLDVLVHDGERGAVFFGDTLGNFNATEPLFIPELPATSALLDANANLVPDVFIAFQNGTRAFWTFEPRDADSSEGTVADALPAPAQPILTLRAWPGGSNSDADGSRCVVLDPVSIAFVDMDGDCLPDLVVPTSCGLEVWSNPADSNRNFWDLSANRTAAPDMLLLGVEVFNAAHGDGSIAFADFDSDGTMDIAVPNRNRQDLVVHLNRQTPRANGELCHRDADWKLESRTGLTAGLNLRRSKVGSMFNSIPIPPSIHIGDYDLDGLPDILAIDASSSRPVLFRNEGLWRDSARREPHFKRMARKQELGLSTGNSGAVTGMFFDTDESGRQDILVVRKSNETRLMWNNFNRQSDSLFFKGTVLSGLPFRPLPRPFAPVPGNTLKLSYMERGSHSRVTRTCSQCPQSGLWQLRPCNCQFGLMRIANYIEEMCIGAGAARRSWTNLMPNSMAVVWPERGSTPADTGQWRMMYFTQRRGGQMLRVTALLALALVVLGFVIIVLQHQERKQDREEDEQERVRLFTFV